MQPLDDLIHDAAMLAAGKTSATSQPIHFKTRAELLKGEPNDNEAEVARVMIPVAVTCCCSGMIVFLYTFAIFFPYTRLIYTLSQSLTGGRS